jgi:DNA-binding MarR family transcriptional regulator
MAGGLPPSLRQRLSFLLGKLYMDALDLEAEDLGRLGLNVKQHAALTLLTDEGAMTQQELGQRLGIDRTTIVAVVDVLEEAAFVRRERSPVDRRAYLLTLTPDGEQVQQRGTRLIDTARRRLLAALDESDQRALVDLLAKAVYGD